MNAHEQTRQIVQFHADRGAQSADGLSLSERRLLAGAYFHCLLESDPGYAEELMREYLTPAHLARMGAYLMQSSQDVTKAQQAARFLAEELADTIVEHLKNDLDKMFEDEVERRANMAIINEPRRPATGAVDRYWAGRSGGL